MNLTHPDDIDAADDSPEHPIPVKTVERAHGMVEPDISVDTLHSHLETAQKSLEHELGGSRMGLYDPIDFFGKIVHLMAEQHHTDRYSHHLFIEDGRYGFDNEENRLRYIASKQVIDELDYDPETDGIEEKIEVSARINERVEELSLDDFSEEEQKSAFGPHFGIWEEVANMLDYDRNSTAIKAVKASHELHYDNRIRNKTKHAVTGFVVGVPSMFWAGMQTEQRMFSALAETKMSPAEITDAYGSRVSYKEASKWGSKRGVSKSAVSQNRSKARKILRNKYQDGTYPDSLTVSYDE